jgi:hypothetical protein
VGLIGRILSFVRAQRHGAQISDVKTDPGGGPNVTAEHFAPAGDDAHPLPGDYVYGAPSPQRGRYAAVGYVDPANQSKAQPGEKRIYSRSSSGAQKAETWLKADGTVVSENDMGSTTLAPDGSFEAENGNGSVTLGADGSILGQNAAGSFELQEGGNFVVNGVTITTAGRIITPTGLTTPSAVIDGVEAAGHRHPQANDSGGNTEQDTGPMQ